MPIKGWGCSTTGLVETVNDNFSGTISDDNVVRELGKAGKSWKAYEESTPSTGYVGNDVAPDRNEFFTGH
jgi:hypothetical protein